MVKPWFERGEAAWGKLWQDVFGVLQTAFRLVRRRLWFFATLALFLLLIRGSFRLLPFEGIEGTALSLLAWSTPFLSMLATLTVVVVVVIKSLGLLRDADEPVLYVLGPRLTRAVPYAFLLFFVAMDNGAGLLSWAMIYVGEAVWGESSILFWTASYYLGMLPVLWLLSRFGFTMVGAAIGDRVSFKDAWEISEPAAGRLFMTLVVWLLAKRLPGDLMILIPFELGVFSVRGEFYSPIGLAYSWGMPIYYAAMTVFFGIVAAVWYDKCRLWGKQERTAMANGHNLSQCQD